MTKSNIAWFSDAESYFIDLIKQHPVLWKVNHKFYAKKTVKRSVIEKITNLMRKRWVVQFRYLTADDLFSKYHNMKNYYRKQKILESKMTSYTGTQRFHPKWEHFDRLSFLDQRMDSEIDSTSAESSEKIDCKDSDSEQRSEISEAEDNLSTDCKPIEITTIIQPEQCSEVSRVPDNFLTAYKPGEATTIILQAAQCPQVLGNANNISIVSKPIEAVTPFLQAAQYPQILGNSDNISIVSKPMQVANPSVPTIFFPVQNRQITSKTITENVFKEPTETLSNLGLQTISASAKDFSQQSRELTPKTVTGKIFKEATETLSNLGLPQNTEDKAFCAYVLSLLESVKDVNCKRRIHMEVMQLIHKHLATMI